MANNVNVTDGSGTSSIAAEQIGNTKYQIIKVVGGETGSTSVMGVNPDRSISVSVIGTPSFTVSGNPSVSGTVGASIIGQLPGGNAILGAVAASISGIVNVSGSVVGFQGGTRITSVSGGVITSISGGISSVALVGANTVSVVGAVTVISSVAAFQGGTWSTSVMTNVITSIATAGQVMGSVAALQGTNPWTVNYANSSILAVPVGSVITLNQGSSILAVPVGSIITVFQAPSLVGTYAEDAASASGDKGFLVMGARNDTLASVTSNDGDYSSHVVGPAGELIAENAPLTKWIQGTASMLGGPPLIGSSVAVIAAQGASIFTYITGMQVINYGATTQFLTLKGATDSVIGFAIAPAGGGSNMYFQNALKTSANGAFTASISGLGAGASVYLAAQGFISKT